MRRRSKAGDKSSKRTTLLGRRNAPKSRRSHGSSVASQETDVQRLTRELIEAREQQAAAADVLKIISRSTLNLQTVLDTLVKSATRLCEAYDSVIFIREGAQLHVRAHHGPIPTDFTNWPIASGWVTGRAVLERQAVHVHDLQAAAQEFPVGAEMAARMGHRTTLAIPLMREGEAIGAILIRRVEVRPFNNRQIELVETFAAQAVIAIENARLLNELRQRTDDLTESLEQQTATSEVLRVISNSLSDTQPVFDAIVQSGLSLFPGATILVALRDQNQVKAAAVAAPDPARAEALRRIFPIPLVREHMNGVAIIDRRVVDISDARNGPRHRAAARFFLDHSSSWRPHSRLFRWRPASKMPTRLLGR